MKNNINFTIEKMTLTDLENIKDILSTEFDDFWNYNILKQELSNCNSYCVVAKNNENIILGFACEQFILDESNITNIVTRKTYRNNGIGSLLLENLIQISISKSMNSITLEVNENNTSAINLYKKYNFNTIGIRKKYYNNKDNALIMSLIINAT